MCMTIDRSKLSNTIIYAAEVEKNGKVFHVLGYQNKALSKKPNAMVLPIPAKELTKDNIIDTREFKEVLEDYQKVVRSLKIAHMRGMKGGRKSRGGSFDSFEIFDSGSYTVIIAKKATAMAEALELVSEAKRPLLSNAFMAKLEEMYKGWPIAICCFEGNIAPEPLLWFYEPINEKQLFAPGMDAHDGNAPDKEAVIERDHTIAFASFRNERQHFDKISRNKVPEKYSWMFLDNIVGAELSSFGLNGDFIFPIEAFNDKEIPNYLNFYEPNTITWGRPE